MNKINLTVCLSDIPKSSTVTTNAGKTYVNLTVAPRKEVSQYGESHSVSITKTRSTMSKSTVYVGKGTEIIKKQ